ncbi:histidine kinase dimerization and phosphoacceptor region [Oscillochloris trichoides DG-6]|uniref:Histidine kinase dimerization and phosphoacceptor region n=1 Tax=Oscillochloris trichoides DG-6 TaxID=765420 RepID=E1IBM7_9CHLR|nr:sensor histidine kinase [Oscillochloris trichoides]EFO81446.1 histidine kinase dimerization and phosphoacceptor region [Oscillochloris trichoides DG-6]
MAGDDLKQQIEQARDAYKDQQERTRREISEVETLVRQSSGEVDKLGQRELSVSSRVRDLEVNLDKYTKEEIKNFFAAAQEVQMRLQIMRAQLDQVQSRRDMLKNQLNQLNGIIELLNDVAGALSNTGPVTQSNGHDDTEAMIAGIIQSQENERLRISLQMHDGPAQSMSNLVLRAEICQRLIDRDLDQARSELTGLKTAINTTLQDTRRFIFDLRPMTLDDLGLVPTLRRYTTQIGEKHNLEINLMIQGLEQRLPSHYEVTIFRFVQEALNNVVRHANANQVRLLLDANGNALQIMIEDDGGGFHINEVLSSANARKNMGIAGMRQQIEVLLRGEFAIESAIGRGTRIAATIPMP